VATLGGNGIDAAAAPGQTGQFDVLSDGRLVFSKHREGRFPEEDEVVALLR
jgi:selT/selW/selH-like putative selenoprotein